MTASHGPLPLLKIGRPSVKAPKTITLPSELLGMRLHNESSDS
jgi:hypothetical protein